jgi:hypothetical protein
LWHKADIARCLPTCPLFGVKQTSGKPLAVFV